MPYTFHDHLNTPEDHTALWRYVDGMKLANLLISKQLFFASGKSLLAHDAFEGTITYDEAQSRNIDVCKLTPEQRRGLPRPDDPELMNSSLQNRRDSSREGFAHLIQSCFFNCWHMNDHESDAMWKIYAHTYGCAIVTTIGKLKTSVAKEPSTIRLGEIVYDDLRGPSPHDDIFVRPFFRKRKPFTHERELRALVYDPDRAPCDGIGIHADPVALIDRLVISPHAEPWFLTSIRALTKTLGYTFNIQSSHMNTATPLSTLKGPSI